ncbi:MAG: CoA-binding protein [Actinomycetota bacterium]|nr:CoA-binding protein [Actinomycetota bacterium]
MKKRLDKFFNAETIAIFGLSPNPGNLGRSIVANCKRWGYSGTIYGISPKAGQNDGIEIFTSLSKLPQNPDLALIFTKASLVPEILLDCAHHGIKHIAVSSAGLEETGTREGKKLSESVKTICREKGLYLVGPNSIATAYTPSGMCLSFMPMPKPPAGKVAFLTQSGGVGTAMVERMTIDAVPLGKFVSLGNKTVLDEVDFLEYLIDDNDTEVICMYLEDLRRGREFLEIAKQAHKPIIVYKANISPYGESAAGSHTAALKNDTLVLEGAFHQTGVIMAKSLTELLHLAKAFQMPLMKGNRLLVLSPSGGLSVVMADLAWRYGFELPPIPHDMIAKYAPQRRAGVIEFRNPLDFGDVYSAEVQRNFLGELLSHNDFDGLVMAYIYREPDVLKFYETLGHLQRDIVAEFNETVDIIKKPVGFMLQSPYHAREHILSKSAYPIFDSPEDAVACLAVMRDYYRRSLKRATARTKAEG